MCWVFRYDITWVSRERWLILSLNSNQWLLTVSNVDQKYKWNNAVGSAEKKVMRKGKVVAAVFV